MNQVIIRNFMLKKKTEPHGNLLFAYVAQIGFCFQQKQRIRYKYRFSPWKANISEDSAEQQLRSANDGRCRVLYGKFRCKVSAICSHIRMANQKPCKNPVQKLLMLSCFMNKQIKKPFWQKLEQKVKRMSCTMLTTQSGHQGQTQTVKCAISRNNTILV